MGKKAIFFVTLILVSVLMANAAGAVPVIIGFKDKAHPELVQQQQGKVKHSYKYIPAVAADLPEQAIENMKKNQEVAYIEPDLEIRALEETYDWGIEKIRAPQVHSTGNKGAGVNVAIIDTGIDYYHPDLAANYKGGKDFVNGDEDPLDDHWHGTHCAGTIVALENDYGLIGAAPAANLYALKALDSEAKGDSSDLEAAIEWAIDTHIDQDPSNNIQIISMSLGSDTGLLSMNTLCTKAYYDYGILLVAAAGNDGDSQGVGDSVDYPGAYSSVIAVAATDSNDIRPYFSSTGPDVELAAPGVNIKSTYLDGKYALASGTSVACPHVAGAAALVFASNPGCDNDDVRAALAYTATDLGDSGRDNWYGFGLVNAEAATGSSTPDETDPVISDVDADAGTETATIIWTTDEDSDSTVRYSTDRASFEQVSDTSQVTTHTVELTGLSANTTYYYEVLSSDAAGNTASDNNNGTYYSFTTLEENSDFIHINDIQVTTSFITAGKKNFVSATAIVKILDDSGSPVKDATISGFWSGATGDTDSALTKTDGTATICSDEVKYKKGILTFNFTVDSVTHSSYTWDGIALGNETNYPTN